MTDFICKNYKETFCNDPMSNQISIEDLKKIDDNVDGLSS